MAQQDHSEGGFTGRLAHWIGTVDRSWPAEAVDDAERAFVDTIGCLVAGAGDDAVRRVCGGIAGWGAGGAASVVGMPVGRDAPWAALVNGTAAHALDYDDVLDPAASHVSAVLVPALFALGEERDASGADLVDAYIVGVEVQECLAEALNMDHYARGWHTTATLGAPAAAAACARLMHLHDDQIRNALSIATSLAGGFKRQFGTNTKPFHAGMAAKNGVVAAQMAACGLTADPAAFEGSRGFLELMAGPNAAGFGSVLGRLAGPPAVVEPGVWLKRYPCCASTHRAVDGLRRIIGQEKLAAADISRVDTLVSEVAVRNLMYVRPRNEMEARFSMAYCLAAAVIDGDLSLATFRADAVGRPDIGAFLDRVTMSSDPDQPADMPSTMKSWATTTVTTRDGRVLVEKVVDPKGYPTNPLDDGEILAKFQDCAAGQPGTIQSAYPRLRRISAVPKLRSISEVLRAVDRGC